MSTFCGTPFWDTNLTWNTLTPDFTQCFQETVLTWVPCVFLWVFSIYEVIRLCRNSHKNFKTPWTFLNITKIILTLLLAGLSLADMIYYLLKFLNGSYFSYPVNYYTAFVKFITFTYITIIILLNRRHGIHTSGVLFIFWVLSSISAAVSFRSSLLIYNEELSYIGSIDEFVYITKIAYFILVIVELILSSFVDASPKDFFESEKKTSPEESSSFLSQITFNWFTSMIMKGYKRPLTQDDMWNLNKENLSDNLLEKFEPKYIQSIENAKVKAHKKTKEKTDKTKQYVSITNAMIKTFGLEFLFIAIIKIAASIFPFASPLIMDQLIYFIINDEPLWKGYFYAVLLFISPMVESLINSQYEFRIQVLGMKVRACFISTIYKKGTKLSNIGKKGFTTGEIVNLMSVDTQRIVEYLYMINNIWTAPVQIIFSMYLLWQQLGIATIAGIVVMIAVFPVNAFITAKFRGKQILIMKQKDKRVKMINEILNGIKILKLYGWEDSFKEKILKYREKEVKNLIIQSYWFSAIIFLFSGVPILVTLASFAAFVLMSPENILDANKAFVSITLFNILRMPMAMLPVVLSLGASALVSLQRINNYLNADELDDDTISHDPNIKVPVLIENGTFSWTADDKPTLNDISVKIKKGKLVAVVGQVGSGKSSLLSAILGDIIKIKGVININGSIAYVPQQAWIQNATLRQNISFIKDMNQQKYNKVIKACALEPDIEILSAFK